MELFVKAFEYAVSRSAEFTKALGEHLQISLLALAIAIAICVPLGIFTSRFGTTAKIIINAIGILRVVPSIAVLIALYSVFGLGFTPAFIALTFLALPPVLINTDTGLREVNQATIEAARGMGMGNAERLLKIELPLALPVIIGGIRTASVEVIASATFAAFIGAGGLGVFIFDGLSRVNEYEVLLVGAIPVALLAFGAEFLLGTLQRLVSPKTADSFKTA